MGVEAHACNTGSLFFGGEEFDLGRGVGEDEEDGDAEDDGYGAFDEEDEGLCFESEFFKAEGAWDLPNRCTLHCESAPDPWPASLRKLRKVAPHNRKA